jgi:hypothetical protein
MTIRKVVKEVITAYGSWLVRVSGSRGRVKLGQGWEGTGRVEKVAERRNGGK